MSTQTATATGAFSRRAAYLLLAAVVLIWGANWPVMKVGLAYVEPFTFTALRMLLGAAALFGVLAATGRLAVPTRRDLPVLLSVGLFQMAGFLACVMFGLQTVDAGRSAILAYTTPLWVTPVAVAVLGERIGAWKGIGLGLGLAGVAAMFNPLGFAWDDPAVVRGNGLLMLAAFCWAVAILHVRAHSWDSSPLQLAPWQMCVAAPILTALALTFEGTGSITWAPEFLAVIAYNAPLATAFCFWGAVTVTRALPAISTSLGFLGVPVLGMLLAAVTLGETLTLTRVSGLVLIVAGMALVNLADLRSD
ncbi:Uncharacterized membrane protein [Limimonas halophila]|uniref:Uncharacterized membrane protein n=1 Tax=Limimonas halophila TaxID=1082479 RepID=A0A1G7RD08_9PROT|nr:DMT family transporter [Limimonas halophila]SDG08671.1 Uncharacterized membrane protein [Limimonas halophila]